MPFDSRSVVVVALMVFSLKKRPPVCLWCNENICRLSLVIVVSLFFLLVDKFQVGYMKVHFQRMNISHWLSGPLFFTLQSFEPHHEALVRDFVLSSEDICFCAFNCTSPLSNQEYASSYYVISYLKYFMSG